MTSPDDQALTLRFVLEGAPGAGSTTVLRQLAEQSYTNIDRRALGPDGGTIEWLTFASGRFEGNHIRLEVFTTGTPLSPRWRRATRQVVDGVILVVDSAPQGVRRAAEHLEGLQRDLAEAEADGSLRPALMVLAHQQDRPDAMEVDAILASVGLAPTTASARTSISHGGVVYALAIAARACLVRLRQLDAAGVPRNAPYELNDLLGALASATPRRAWNGSEAPTESTATQLASRTLVSVAAAPASRAPAGERTRSTAPATRFEQAPARAAIQTPRLPPAPVMSPPPGTLHATTAEIQATAPSPSGAGGPAVPGAPTRRGALGRLISALRR